MYFCSRISVPCFFNDAFLLYPYLNISVWLKRKGMAGQLGGCAPFPVLAGTEKGDTQLSEMPSFRIQPYSSWQVITYALSCWLGLLWKMCLSRLCPLGRNSATRQWAGIFTLAVVGLLFWGQCFGFEQMLFTWRWQKGFFPQAAVNELMPARSAASGGVLRPRVKICLWSWQCGFCVCLYHISSVVITEQ